MSNLDRDTEYVFIERKRGADWGAAAGAAAIFGIATLFILASTEPGFFRGILIFGAAFLCIVFSRIAAALLGAWIIIAFVAILISLAF